MSPTSTSIPSGAARRSARRAPRPSARRAAAPAAARPRTWGLGGRRAAWRRGTYRRRATPQPLGRVLRRQHVQVHAGADLEARELGEARHHLDAPAEALGVPRRGAHPHVERRQLAERRRPGARSDSCSRRAPSGPSSEKRARRPARHDLEVERHARPERAERHGLVVDREDALAPAHLLLDQVLEQVAPLRAVRVGGEALALARDRRRHERQRVELGVGVRQRRARLLALVDDHVDVGRVRVGAHPLAPDATWRPRPARASTSASEWTGSGAFDDHLVVAGRGLGGEQVRLAAAARRAGRSPGVSLARATAPGRGSAPRAPASCRSSPRSRKDLGRRAVLVAGRERVGLGVDRRPRRDVEKGARPRAALAGDDHAQAR